jgi:hypothetical protein
MTRKEVKNVNKTFGRKFWRIYLCPGRSWTRVCQWTFGRGLRRLDPRHFDLWQEKQSTDETEKQSNCLNSPTATFVDWKFFQEKNINNIFEPKVVFNEGCTKRFSPNLLLLVDGKNRVFLSPTLRCWAVQPRGFPFPPSPPHSSLTTVWSCSNSSDTYWPDNWRPKFLKEKWWFLFFNQFKIILCFNNHFKW